MKTIIAPTDFSLVSVNAVNYAADMAVEINAELLLLHAAELPLTFSEYGVYDAANYSTNRETDLNDLREAILKRTENKIAVNTKYAFGTIELELKELCNQIKPFAVVMATHRPGILERFFTGSITIYTARHILYPVLVVPEGITYKPIKKIALASDFKSIYGISMNEIQTIITSFNASLDIIHINTSHGGKAVESSLLEHYLRAFKPRVHVIYSGDVEKGLEAFALKNQIDLLLILPKKHGPFYKSLTEQVILHSSILAMSIHEGEDLKNQ